jgi:hypothetical protein
VEKPGQTIARRRLAKAGRRSLGKEGWDEEERQEAQEPRSRRKHRDVGRSNGPSRLLVQQARLGEGS